MSPTLVALDPGTRRAGVAVFDVGLGLPLRAVGLLTNRASVAAMVDEITIALADVDVASSVLLAEWPRKYKTRRACHDDIDGLRAVVDAVAAWGWHRTWKVAPSTWKGNVPKPIHHRRVAAGLTDETRRAIGWDALGPDARDAVALGQWALRAGYARLLPPNEGGS